jgi:DNA-binding transcriptional ArsR family regulator
MGGELHYPTREELDLVEVLQALGDPVRLDMLRRLDAADGAVACGQLGLPIVKSTASHHFKVLREAGVVLSIDHGTRRYYTIRREDLDARFPGLLDSVLGAG